jgi:transcriptional regulator with XRE-family HTH domain
MAPGSEELGLEEECRAMGVHRGYCERSYAFGQQILTLRTRAVLTQIALAEQIGVNRCSVQNWETGESYPKAETLQRLIAVLLAQRVLTPGQEAIDVPALYGRDAELTTLTTWALADRCRVIALLVLGDIGKTSLQFARSTPLEQALLLWLAIARDLPRSTRCWPAAARAAGSRCGMLRPR